jgi:hypothetical protein
VVRAAARDGQGESRRRRRNPGLKELAGPWSIDGGAAPAIRPKHRAKCAQLTIGGVRPSGPREILRATTDCSASADRQGQAGDRGRPTRRCIRSSAPSMSEEFDAQWLDAIPHLQARMKSTCSRERRCRHAISRWSLAGKAVPHQPCRT